MTRRPEPSDHPRAPFGGAMVGAEGAGHADHGSPVGRPQVAAPPPQSQTSLRPSLDRAVATKFASSDTRASAANANAGHDGLLTSARWSARF
jgi:hypothetical protein